MNGLKLLFALAALAQLSPARAAEWPDTSCSRIEALALIQTLNASLLASRSATFTLEKWCADHHLASEPRIRARLSSAAAKPASAQTRQRLGVDANEPVRHRHVDLACGEHVLSEADNWYVPARLTPEMNRLLETGDTPFGRAVQDLKPYRITFEMQVLWSPLEPGWESGIKTSTDVSKPLIFPQKIFEHRAVLYTTGQIPFSEVDEVYSGEVLAFAAPAGLCQ